MVRHTIRTVLLGVIVLVSITPAAATPARQGPTPIVTTDYERMGQVVVSGQVYELYTYDSPLPYVGGLAIYRGGDPIRSRTAVERVVRVHARQTAVAGLRRDELETIRRLRDRGRTLAANVSAALATINATLDYTRALENTTVGNRTAWNASLAAAPGLEGLVRPPYRGGTSDLAALRATLVEVRRSATALSENATAVITMVGRQRNGTSIDKTALFRHYSAVLGALDRTTSLAEDVEPTLATTANRTDRIATNVSTVPEVGATLSTRFRALTSQLRSTAVQLSAVTTELPRGRTALGQVDRRAAAMRERLLHRWTSRGTVRAKVYGSIAEGLILALAGILTTIQYRRD